MSSVRRKAFETYVATSVAVRSRLPAPRLRPGFVIIGAQKAGTTSLHKYLLSHPGVARPLRKEIHYFDLYHDRGPKWYGGFFPSADQGDPKITGESTPYYMFHPLAPKRVFDFSPDTKLIVLVRNPIDRAISHYSHNDRRAQNDRPIEVALVDDHEWVAEEEARLISGEIKASWRHQHHSYLARGRYIEQLERWAGYFSRENILVLRSEDLFSAPLATYTTVLEYLGLELFEPPQFAKFNQRPDSTPSRLALRRDLADHFAPYNHRLYAWLNRDLGWDEPR